MTTAKFISIVVVATAGFAASTAQSQAVTYTYDALGRLTGSSTAGGGNAGKKTAICYDDAGNRSQYVVVSSGTPTCNAGAATATSAEAANLAVDAGSRTHTSDTDISSTSDAAANDDD